jgi:hypothetical protein
MEAHLADRIAGGGSQGKESDDALAAKASAIATSDLKKTVQPELDALNRAMRRYEKRTTISAVQIEARLQDLETRLNDVVSLAAAAQRNVDRRTSNYTSLLLNWISATIVVPVQSALYLASLPGKLITSIIGLPARYVRKDSKGDAVKEKRNVRKINQSRSHERERRPKTVG